MTTVADVLNSDKTAILIVDFQHDFMEGGALAVGGADFVGSGKEKSYQQDVENFVELCRKKPNLTITWSQDWHPEDHSSFANNNDNAPPFAPIKLKRDVDGKEVEYDQMMWPIHCVQDTKGSELVMPAKEGEYVQKKGTRKLFDSYSAFTDDGGDHTGLDKYLKEKGIENVVCFGLATDFCVYFGASDSSKLGYKTYTIKDLCRGIDPKFDWGKYTDCQVDLWSLEEAISAVSA